VKCKACSYTPPTEPKVFCPACGAVWFKASEPKPERKVKVPVAPKPVVEKKPTVKKTSGNAKRNKK
jgi:uncharacterized Zn finger protein (UPF0148 family)